MAPKELDHPLQLIVALSRVSELSGAKLANAMLYTGSRRRVSCWPLTGCNNANKIHGMAAIFRIDHRPLGSLASLNMPACASTAAPLLARGELGTGTLFHPHGGRLGCVMDDDGQDMATR